MTKDPIAIFNKERESNIKKMGRNGQLKKIALDFIRLSSKYQYSYNFDWLGRPIIQFPQDVMTMQEIIWMTKPDLIIETGVAHGGSLIFYASMLALLGGNRKVVGIDIDIREHNRKKIEKHPLANFILMIEGSSTDPAVVQKVQQISKKKRRILVVLDSLHIHTHVLQELRMYSQFVKKGGYFVVFDTIIEFMPKNFSVNRPWSKGNNPWTAVQQFLKEDKKFIVDRNIENKLLITVAPGGYLKRTRD